MPEPEQAVQAVQVAPEVEVDQFLEEESSPLDNSIKNGELINLDPEEESEVRNEGKDFGKAVAEALAPLVANQQKLADAIANLQQNPLQQQQQNNAPPATKYTAQDYHDALRSDPDKAAEIFDELIEQRVTDRVATTSSQNNYEASLETEMKSRNITPEERKAIYNVLNSPAKTLSAAETLDVIALRKAGGISGFEKQIRERVITETTRGGAPLRPTGSGNPQQGLQAQQMITPMASAADKMAAEMRGGKY